MPRTRTWAAIIGGIVALAITGVAWAHPGGLVDRADVLARALGITSDEVEQAREDGTLRTLVGDLTLNQLSEAYGAELDAIIAQALADGTITAEQAERLNELDLGDGALGAFGGSFGGRFGTLEEFDREDLDGLHSASIRIRIDLRGIYAGLLAMTADQFDAAAEDGTVRDLIDALDPVAVQAAIVEARDAQIDEALAAGDITEDQAETLRSSTFGTFGGFGGRGGFRGGSGFGHGSEFGGVGRFGPHAAPSTTPDAEGTATRSSTGISI
ncbi:MAG: hypothetical protein O3A10_15595 [Chloroflexi bacterium]|nr:hypothetical protein [Chloroflexota bacterium]MDA1147952.1 hypothetical protein [Chloroflexota bacterium]